MTGKVLIADDDSRVNELLQDIFTMEGYQVSAAYNGREVLEQLAADDTVDLLILDVMMPELDGWDILHYVKEHFDVKVLMLTALDDAVSEIRCFQEGADDYVAKPFHRAVLAQRAKRLVQEKRAHVSQDYRCGELLLRQSTHTVFVAGEERKLTSKEYQLLLLFLENSNVVLSRETILTRVWGVEYGGGERTLDTHIKMLRRSLKEYGQNIRTVRGVGYCFDGEVTRQ
ncbi:MAG: response regulator transcription factor [Clostridiales bacterium]|nr:response regulator transcription factor [Clostridiales bacterium]